ncbi:hypothetical protein ACO0RG_004390 [Hanseniaspora osmophila]
MYHSSAKKNTYLASRVLAEKNVNENIVAQSRLKAKQAHVITKQKAKKRALYVKKPLSHEVTKKVKMAPSQVPSMQSLVPSDKLNIHSTLFHSNISKPTKRTLKSINNSYLLNNVLPQIGVNNVSDKSSNRTPQHLQYKQKNSFSTNDTPLTEKLHAHNLNLSSNSKQLVNPLTAQNIAHLQYAIKQTEEKLVADCGHALCQKFYAILQNPSIGNTGPCAEWEMRCQMFHDMDLFADQDSLIKGNIRQKCYLDSLYPKVTSLFKTIVDNNSTLWHIMKTIADCTDEFPFPVELMLVPEIDEQFLHVHADHVNINKNEDEIFVHITSFDDGKANRTQDHKGKTSKFLQQSGFVANNSGFPKKLGHYPLFPSREMSLSQRKTLIDESSRKLQWKENLQHRAKPCSLLSTLNKNVFDNTHAS